MAYRLKLNEAPASALRRIGQEELSKAAALLAAADKQKRATAIHETRRALKRVRSLLLLCETVIGRKRCTLERRRLAGIARGLAEARDLHVMGECVRELASNGDLSSKTMRVLHRSLNSEQHAQSASNSDLAHAIGALEEAKERLAGLARGGRRADFLAGLRRGYRRCRKALDVALEHPNDEMLHNLRKHIQSHWRHMQLVRRIWPEAIDTRIHAARQLSQWLGDDHDLYVLQNFADRALAGTHHAKARNEVREVCSARQHQIRLAVEPLVRKLLAEKPAAFEARMAVYWRAAVRDRAAMSQIAPESP